MATRKHNFNIKANFSTAEVERLFQKLERIGQRGARQIMTKMRIKGIEHAQELLDRLVYLTPERGYERTGKLRNSVKGFVRRDGGVTTLYMFVETSKAPYAQYVEHGTFDQARSEAEIIELAQREARENLEVLILEFGKEGKGMEARPFMYPTKVWLEIQLPKEFEDYIMSNLKGI